MPKARFIDILLLILTLGPCATTGDVVSCRTIIQDGVGLG